MQPLAWLVALAPLAVLAVGCVPANLADREPRRMTSSAFAALCTALLVAVLAAVAIAMQGCLNTGTLGVAGVGFGLYLDGLTASMLLLVAFVGTIVVRYSRNYLAGDPGQGRFTKWLCVTVGAVLLLIISGNLLQFAIAWFATSLGLHHLLLFYPDRQAAVLAARKKFLASRLGDLCLLTAAALIYRSFGSLDYATLFSGAGSFRGPAPFLLRSTPLPCSW